MIRMQCPSCDKRLGIQDEQAGKVGICPACNERFNIPAAPAAEAITTSRPRKKAAPGPRNEAPPPARLKRRRSEDDEDESFSEEDEEDERPVRKGGRKQRKSASGLSAYTITLIGLGAVGLLLLGLAFVWPALSLAPMVLGYLTMAAGGIWFLVVAFQDSPVSGLLCLFVPFFSLFYLVMHFEEEKKPFFMQLLGFALAMLGLTVSIIRIRPF
jgi:hypothetical protein